ncbi:ArsR/SmtB family transcription factor [Paenibacillus lutrae]|uniref:Metalloregulator ArsR/SmtB family transcription factor n=1 Tax=Paenibacillus lutrae TaxID=2078573 RepID=A0A7X3FFI8_9BACL|nr:metalloregulator ArsR/SmtB family transcription factor [Paenibacillus lutrae]MVO98774.1 metalloregulator ArsR/SmtB family transcription factor [Paenibacillus lutrae]
MEQYQTNAELLKALSHPVRLCIVKGLADKGDCKVSDMQQCLKLQQSTLSMHLQKLRAAGIIEGSRRGLEVFYRLKQEKVKELLDILF